MAQRRISNALTPATRVIIEDRRPRFLGALLAGALIAAPMAARADETPPPAPVMLFAPDIHTRIAPARTAIVPSSPEPIRLSKEAKTIIIVSAIVVGALIIIGVIALNHPHGP
jgi:hypothetical protein